MSHRLHHRRATRTISRGMATLEFAMALPFILLLMVGITWLAYSVIGQAQVLVQARNDAWRQRFEDLAKQPLMFPSGIGDAKNPFYSTENDYVTKTVSKKVSISPIFDSAPGPKASVMVLAGSWDHRALDLNNPPNFTLYLRAAANGATKGLQSELSQITNLINEFEQNGVLGIASAIASGNDAANAASNSKSTGEAGDSADEQKKEQDKEKLEQEQKDLGGVVNDKPPFGNGQIIPINGGQLDQTNDEIDKLTLDLKTKNQQPALSDKDAEKKRQDDIAKETRQLQLLQDKKKRIEAQIQDDQEELNAYK